MSKIFCAMSYGKLKLAVIFLLACIALTSLHHAEACSSRTISKPRPTSASSSATPPSTTLAPTTTTTTTTTPRPNITFPTYKCPATFDAWYCLNEATCFSVKIGDSIMYNCECASGFMGPRCEYKELDGSLLPKRPRPRFEKASIASGAICAFVFMSVICLTLYLRSDFQNSYGIYVHANDETDVCLEKCRFCNEKSCCTNTYPADLIADAEGFRKRQHIEAFPLSFPVKRSTKL